MLECSCVRACVRACVGGWVGGWVGGCVCVCLCFRLSAYPAYPDTQEVVHRKTAACSFHGPVTAGRDSPARRAELSLCINAWFTACCCVCEVSSSGVQNCRFLLFSPAHPP